MDSITKPLSTVSHSPSQNGAPSPAATQGTRVIVLGNEKGGSGKTTAALHLIVALMKAGFKTGAMDLDIRQKSLSRYLENRAIWGLQYDVSPQHLPMPLLIPAPYSNHDSRAKAYELERQGLAQAFAKYENYDYLVIDCPGADTHLSRLAHAHADTIITPMNDSFIDFDLLAHMDTQTGEIAGPSVYSNMVWEARQNRALSGHQIGIDWVVMRNRIGANAKNKKRVGAMLDKLSSRFGFRQAAGLRERVIYRELFLQGLTMLDLGEPKVPRKLSGSNMIAARREMEQFISVLNLQPKAAIQKAS
ncbi:MAG: division plane positioning ATPase MipZ [bacterium]